MANIFGAKAISSETFGAVSVCLTCSSLYSKYIRVSPAQIVMFFGIFQRPNWRLFGLPKESQEKCFYSWHSKRTFVVRDLHFLHCQRYRRLFLAASPLFLELFHVQLPACCNKYHMSSIGTSLQKKPLMVMCLMSDDLNVFKIHTMMHDAREHGTQVWSYDRTSQQPFCAQKWCEFFRFFCPRDFTAFLDLVLPKKLHPAVALKL